jgi:hypothetical protein
LLCFEFHKRTNKTTEHKQFNYNIYKQIQILILLPKTFISFVFPIFWPWSYPMKVTPEICSAHYISPFRSRNCLSFASTWTSPVFGGVRLVHLFCFLCGVIWFVFLSPVSCVSNVASVFGLSIHIYKQIQILILLPKTFISFVFPIFWPWSYPMKVTPEICSAPYITYLRLYYYYMSRYTFILKLKFKINYELLLFRSIKLA